MHKVLKRVCRFPTRVTSFHNFVHKVVKRVCKLFCAQSSQKCSHLQILLKGDPRSPGGTLRCHLFPQLCAQSCEKSLQTLLCTKFSKESAGSPHVWPLGHSFSHFLTQISSSRTRFGVFSPQKWSSLVSLWTSRVVLIGFTVDPLDPKITPKSPSFSSSGRRKWGVVTSWSLF